MRTPWLDALRGIAVVWMIIFHTSYDMMLLNFVDWDFTEGFWWAFPRLIAGTFLFCVGAALNFVHSPKVNTGELKKRIVRIGGSALLVSLGTYLAFPTHWIYFGTLHCILAGSLLAAPLVSRRHLALILLILIMTAQYVVGYDIQWVSSVLRKPSLDFIPIYPWFWVILAGLLLGPHLSRIEQLRTFKCPRFLALLGQHSLKIYLLHQPLIYGLLYLARSFVFR